MVSKIKKKISNILLVLKIKFFNKRYNSSEINIIKTLDCLVVSGGGAGTTTIIEFLTNHLRVNDIGDNDKLKHKYKPYRDKSIYKNTKILFLKRNKSEAIKSLKKRGIPPKTFYELNFTKLESILYQVSNKFNFEIQFKFLLFKQEKNWKNNFSKKQLLLLEYESVFEKGEEIINFLNLDSKLLKDFPIRN